MLAEAEGPEDLGPYLRNFHKICEGYRPTRMIEFLG
jgi:hypothetical protein